MLFIKYVDDKIDEVEIVRTSFEGVRIPVFMLKSSDAEYINDVLSSTGDLNELKILLEH